MTKILEDILKQLKDNIVTLIVAAIIAAGFAVWGWLRNYVVIEVPVGAVVVGRIFDQE